MAKRPRRIAWSHGPLTAGLHPMPPETVHYVRRVLRLQDGAALELFDGQGATAAAVLVGAGADLAVQVSAPHQQPASTARISLAVALPKGERADWLVEKITELGVDELVWLQCERSVVTPNRLQAKLERWQRVAAAAARQAGRNTLPTVRAPTALQTVVAEPRQGLRLVAHPHGRSGESPWPRANPARQARVLIGPEGGLTEEELRHATAAGYTPWLLNRHILRIETAAVAAATLLAGWAHETEPA